MALAGFLKQSTAVNVMAGPFVDETDGKTAETGLTISQADVRLSKNAGDMAQKSDNTALVHDEIGIYLCELDATDTNTLGILSLFVHESGALPVRQDFMVLPANVYDSLVSTDKLQVDVAEWLGAAAATPTVAGVPEVDVTHVGGDAQSATDLKDFADVGYDPATNKVEGVKTADALTTNNDKTGYSLTVTPPTAGAVADAVWDEARTDHVAAGSFGQSLQVIRSGTAQAGAAGSITLDASASAVDDFYKDAVVLIIGGTGVGQARRVSAYVGSTKVASVTPNWKTNPDGTSVFVVLPEVVYVSISGAGALQRTIGVTVGGNPLEGASVWVATDAAGTNIVAGPLTTSSGGVVTVLLDAGTFYVWVQKDGYDAIVGQSIVIS